MLQENESSGENYDMSDHPQKVTTGSNFKTLDKGDKKQHTKQSLVESSIDNDYSVKRNDVGRGQDTATLEPSGDSLT